MRASLLIPILAAISVRSTTFNFALSTVGHTVPSTLYELMFEDINLSSIPEMEGYTVNVSATRSLTLHLHRLTTPPSLKKPSFPASHARTTAALNAWSALNPAFHISVVKSGTPVSTALPNSLSLAVPAGTTGTVGFANSGYFGINVQSAWTTTGPSSTASHRLPRRKFRGPSRSDSSSPRTRVNREPVHHRINGATVAGQAIEFAMLTCFPPTFLNRINGMRLDLSETLQAMRPSFFRFPGGNNLEGGNTASRWDRQNTIGDLVDRPGRSYINTHGLGLYDHLQWIEDMGMQPIMAVWGGYSLDGDALPAGSLSPYIQDAINQYALSYNSLAVMRSSVGNPAPFALKHIEIGNEDFFASSYSQGIGSPHIFQPQSVPLSHVTGFFTGGCYNFDILQRHGLQFFQGEYATTTTNAGTQPYPSIDGSIAEAAYMTGFSRNSDSLCHSIVCSFVEPCSQHPMDTELDHLLAQHCDPFDIMFSLYKGNTYLNSATNSAASAVQWSATKNTTASLIYLKAINMATTSNTVVFTLPFTILSTAGAGAILTAPSGRMNSPTNPNAAVPKGFIFTAGKTLTRHFRLVPYAAYGDLLQLSQTNRTVNDICRRWIYRSVVLEDPVRAVGCCKTLISNIEASNCVRFVVIRFHPRRMLKSFCRILRMAFYNLKSLQSIEISTSPELFATLSDIHFPRLRECSIPFCVDVISFLQLHPKMVALSLDPVPHHSVLYRTSIPAIHLPDLQMFSGPEIVALSVIPQSRASHILIFWDPRLKTEFSGAFEAMASSGTPLFEVQNILVTWDTTLLTAISKCIPNLTSLSVRNVSSIPLPVQMELFFTCLDETIKSLRSLTSLCVIQGALPVTLDTDDLDWEFHTVRKWGDMSPALHCCLLPSETKWVRIRPNVWYPSNHTDNTTDMLARFRWFVTTVIRSTSLPAEYTTVLEVIGGKEMVGALKAAFEKEGEIPDFVLTEKPAGIAMTFSAA
ncbi:hypothetical protein C8R44DRAFT_895132 [Mycena epipterygia]|nr:hypothetical protein C8R44DRAFT_895132 [Mycena epipterygia]